MLKTFVEWWLTEAVPGGRPPYDPTVGYEQPAMSVETQIDPAKVAQLMVDVYCKANRITNKADVAHYDIGSKDLMMAFQGREKLLKRAKDLGFIQGGKFNLQDPHVARALGIPVGGMKPMSPSAGGRTARSFNQLPTD